MPGKRVQIDPETWTSLDLLGKDRMMTFQELFDEAVRDLLKKHNRPQNLKDALRKSARQKSRGSSLMRGALRSKIKRNKRAA